MAAFLRAKLSSFAASHSTINALLSQSQRFTLNAGGFCRGLASKSSQQTATKSPFNSNLLRILHNEIDYLCAYAPSQPIAATFNDFTVEDHPAEQWVTLKRKFQDDEDIKIEATMFDGSVPIAPNLEMKVMKMCWLHISLLVDIWKKGGCDSLEFVCSAWPDSLEVQSVYIFKREGLQLSQPYMGPNVKNLNNKLQDGVYEFLERRGIDGELSAFLHNYMMNKDKTELIRWLRRIKSFIDE